MQITQGNVVASVSQEYWLSLLQAAQCFSVGFNNQAAASNYPVIQLWNPGASGKTVLVRTIVAGCSANAVILLGKSLTQYAGTNTAGLNLRPSFPISKALFGETDQTVPDLLFWASWQVLGSQVYTPLQDWICVLPPGTGLYFYPNVTASFIVGSIVWSEI